MELIHPDLQLRSEHASIVAVRLLEEHQYLDFVTCLQLNGDYF